MKKVVFLFIGICISTFFAQAIPLELTPIAGYSLPSSSSFEEGDIIIDDSFVYGFILSVPDLKGGFSLDFTYSRADSSLTFETESMDFEDDKIKMASNYFLFGGNKDFGKEKFRFFIGADLGAAWFDAKDSSVEDVWSFAFDLKGGLKFYINEHIGLRAQGRFLAPFQFSESGFFLGIGTGGGNAGISLGGNNLINQGDFSLGLVIRL